MKTVKRIYLSTLAMSSGKEKKISQVIIDGNVMTWVGIGWVNEGKATKAQLRTLPRVVD